MVTDCARVTTSPPTPVTAEVSPPQLSVSPQPKVHRPCCGGGRSENCRLHLSSSFNRALTKRLSRKSSRSPAPASPRNFPVPSQKRSEGPQSECWLFPLPPKPSWQAGRLAPLIWPLEGASFPSSQLQITGTGLPDALPPCSHPCLVCTPIKLTSL